MELDEEQGASRSRRHRHNTRNRKRKEKGKQKNTIDLVGGKSGDLNSGSKSRKQKEKRIGRDDEGGRRKREKGKERIHTRRKEKQDSSRKRRQKQREVMQEGHERRHHKKTRKGEPNGGSRVDSNKHMEKEDSSTCLSHSQSNLDILTRVFLPSHDRTGWMKISHGTFLQVTLLNSVEDAFDFLFDF